MMTKQNEKTNMENASPLKASKRNAIGNFMKRPMREGIIGALPCVRARRLVRLKEQRAKATVQLKTNLEVAMGKAIGKALAEAKAKQNGLNADELKSTLDCRCHGENPAFYPKIFYKRTLPDSSAGFFTMSEIIGTRRTGNEPDDSIVLLFKNTIFEVLPNGTTKEAITETACIYEFWRLMRKMDRVALKDKDEYAKLHIKRSQWDKEPCFSSLVPFADIREDGLHFFLRDGRFVVSPNDSVKLAHDEDGRLVLDPRLVKEMSYGKAIEMRNQ